MEMTIKIPDKLYEDIMAACREARTEVNVTLGLMLALGYVAYMKGWYPDGQADEIIQ